MPLTINQYATWAEQHATGEVALNKGASGLENASNQVGAFARFFGTKAAQSVRKDVMTDFTRALSAQFGASLAREALADAGLTPTSKLEGKTIRAVIEYAQKLQKVEVDSMLTQDLRLKTDTVTLDDIKTFGKSQVESYLGLRRLAIDALGEMPLDAGSLDDFLDRAGSIVDRLTRITNSVVVPPSSGTFAKIYADASALVNALSDKMDEMSAMLKGQPLSEDNITDFKAVWGEGALRAMNSLKQAASPKLRAAIDTVMQDIRTNPDAFLDAIPVAKDTQKPIAELIVERLKAQVPSKEITFKESFIAKLVSAGYRQALNSGEWPVISKNVTASVGNVPVELTSKIVPGSRIGAPSDDATGPIGETYDPGVNGYMCHSADTKHAVNLAVSSLSVKDDSGNDQLVFRGVRHGVHCAWEIDDPGKRAEANVKRAEEAVIAAFLADPANAGKVQNGEINLNMVSVSLLTPDVTRHAKHHLPFVGGGSDERQMLREQKVAWDAVSRNGVTFQHNGQTVTIRPRVFTFNLGVNAGAVRFGSVAPHLAGGWDVSADMNLRAHTDLYPVVDAFVKDTSIPLEKRRAVKTLFNQCARTLNAGGERTDSHDAYKVAARYAVLAHLIGATPCWNCKSGKDRTGQMDVECKFLSTLIARGEPIPEPGAKLTAEQRSLFQAIALGGGNFEVQKANTGFEGFKTGGVSSIPERLGGQEYRDFHKGGSSNVGV